MKRIFKFITLLIALCMLVNCCFSNAFAFDFELPESNESDTESEGELGIDDDIEPIFDDVSKDNWESDAVNDLSKKDIVSGFPDGTFHSNDAVTREQLVKMLAEAFDLKGTGSTNFTDVENGRWSASYISAAVANGIVKGTGDGTFFPEDNVTRQDAAVMLYNLCGVKGISLTEETVPTDSGSISEYAKKSVCRLLSAGIVSGFSDGSFHPNEALTRAQAAKMIYNLLNLSSDENSGSSSQEKTEADIATEKGYKENVEFLTALGLYKFSDREYRDNVKRGEFAEMIMNLLGGSDISADASEVSYSDVTAQTEHADAISYVSSYKIMEAAEKDKFYPNESITYMQALKAVVNALGYSEAASARGGDQKGYLNIAQSIGLLKYSMGNLNAPLSFERAVMLLCLAAETEVCEPSDVSSESVTYTRSKNRLLINVYHDIYSENGIMTDNGRTMVNKRKTAAAEAVVIGGKILHGATNRERALIGRNITYYYREKTGVPKLLYAYVNPNKNDIVTLKAEQIMPESSDFSKQCVVARVNGKSEKYNIDIYANLLYNGIFDDTFTKNSFNITEGSITLIDADKDGDYELVCVDEYVDIVVENHIVNDRISSAYSVPDFSSVSYKDCDTVIFEDENGSEIEPKEVLSKDVLSIYKSKDNKMMRAVQSRNKKTISVDSIGESDNTLVVSYEDESYKLSGNYISLMRNRPDLYSRPEAGSMYEVQLNFENKIVMMKQTYGQKQYAYLLAVSKKGTGVRSDDVQLKLHLETDDTVVVTAAKKITINREKNKSPEDLFTNSDLFVSGKFVPQLVSVVLKGQGTLAAIETDNNANSDFFLLDPNGDGAIEDDEISKISENIDNYSVRYRPGKFSLDYYSGDNTSGARYKGIDFISVNGGVCITQDTKIFLVLHNKGNLQTADSDEVKVIPYSQYAGGWLGNSAIKVYDTDITWAAGAAVVTETYSYTWTMLFVNDTSYVTDAYGETKQRVSGYFGSYGYYTFHEYEADVLKKAVLKRYPGSDGAIKKGDVIMVGFSGSQEIGQARLLYSPARDNDPDFCFVDIYNSSTATKKTSRYSVESMIALGRLCAYKDGRLGLFTKSNPTYAPNQNFSTQPVDNASDSYWVHSADKQTQYFQFDCETNELKSITQFDIAASCDFDTDSTAYTEANYSIANLNNYSDDTKCFIMRSKGILKTVYIVKNWKW